MPKRKRKNAVEKQKNNRRARTPYSALKPELNLRSRVELIDYDYIDKLSPDEKAWLNKFTDEYVNDHLDRKDLNNNLHNTKALKKSCGDRNNARNRDILTRIKASGEAVYLEDIKGNEAKIRDFLGKERDDFDDSCDDTNDNTDSGNNL
jgi:hypothetical protein